jgi:hypothetical protein
MTTCTLAPRLTARRILLFALGALVLAACGDGGGPDATVTPTPLIVINPDLGSCGTDLAQTPPDLTIFAADAGDFLADRFSLAGGDFNGDGVDDLLVGAPLADGPDNARENAGEAYIIFGSASLPAQIDLALDAPDVAASGESEGDNFGFTVAAGDVNGDGIDDAIVGARFAATEDKIGTGAAYILFGRTNPAATVDTANGDQDVTIIGADLGDFLTSALTTGDVDGDGAADLILGSSGANGPDNLRRNAGEVAVVLGAADLPAIIDLADTPTYFTVFAASADDGIPNHLAAGDVDGDGRDEIVIGAPTVDAGADLEDAGRVYVLPVPEKSGTLDLAEGKGFTEIVGGSRRDGLGFQVASGDLNDDGRQDVIAGARDADGRDDAATNSGEVHVLLGSDDLPDSIDLAEQPADAIIYGRDAIDSFGFSVATGDFNADGVTDLLAGAPVADSCDNLRPDAGEAYALFGRPDPARETTLPGGANLLFSGVETEDELGFSVATGDFNGDGLDDVALGALQADGPDNGRANGGEVYIIYSREP